MRAMEQGERIWILFETDELGNPEKKLAGSETAFLNLYFEKPDSLSSLENATIPTRNKCFDLPIQCMGRDWQASVSLQRKWQRSILHQCQVGKHEVAGVQVTSGNPFKIDIFYSQNESLPPVVDQGGFSIFKQESGQRDVSQTDEIKENDRNAIMILPTYRLHVENPDNDCFSLGLASALILNRSLIEQKHNCFGKDLQNLRFLNLNHEGISSLGDALLSHLCPKAKVLTADMNRLNSVRNAFIGYAETLEQLSLKDNFLFDLVGLENLHKLQVMHLDGNHILHLTASSFLNSHNSFEPIDLNVDEQGDNLSKEKFQSRFFWPELKELGLSCNRISKVERLGLLFPKLQILDLGSNNLSLLGCLEENGLSGLQYLRVLDVGQNRLKGRSLWANLVHCPLLVSLVASRNLLQELPTHTGSVFLRELWLNGNLIKCFACTAWMPNLQRLYLQDNEIDMLMPIWGFPSLEVLDLSFNKISNVQLLRQLGCFSKLRSLQLNDNPVAELPNYTDKVLEAVPWLLELDNEPLTEYARHQAVRNIFSNVINSIGIWFVRSNIIKSKAPWSGVMNFLKPRYKMSQSAPWTVNRYTRTSNNLQVNENEAHDWDPPISLNKVLAGDSCVTILWAILLEVWRNMCDRESHSNSPSVEYQWSFYSFQSMCMDQKRMLSNSSRESCLNIKLREYSLQNSSEVELGQESMHAAQENKRNGGNIFLKDGYISDLVRFMWEHMHFVDNNFREKLYRNENYEAEIKSHFRRILKVQAVVRGFLVRRKCREHMHHNLLIAWKDNEAQQCCAASKIQKIWRGFKERHIFLSKVRVIVKLQALWRGVRTRRRFHMAIERSNYDDCDEFEYMEVDESVFLPKNICFEQLELSNENMYSSSLNLQEQGNQKFDCFYEERVVCQSDSSNNVHGISHCKVVK